MFVIVNDIQLSISATTIAKIVFHLGNPLLMFLPPICSIVGNLVLRLDNGSSRDEQKMNSWSFVNFIYIIFFRNAWIMKEHKKDILITWSSMLWVCYRHLVNDIHVDCRCLFYVYWIFPSKVILHITKRNIIISFARISM